MGFETMMPAKTKPQTQQLSATVDADGLSSIVRYTLPNGLRVWVKPRPGSDTVAILGQVPVGSRHETEANNGISHFVEHMVFTGTKRWGEQEVMEVIRRQGGYVHPLIGNHEAMNIYGDLRYVVPEEYEAFRTPDSESARSQHDQRMLKQARKSSSAREEGEE